VKDAFLDRTFRSRNLADFTTEIHIGREKPEHANALNISPGWVFLRGECFSGVSVSPG